MKKEIKISELARIWNVSVNATWTRIKKEGLITIKKMDNNREITFVTISDEILNKYQVNNVNNGVNNGNYEELLTDDNTSQPLTSTEIIDKIIKFSNEVQERLITVNNEHNEVVNKLNEELLTCKQKMPFLEDKAGRECTYLKEINELKKVNNRNHQLLITVIISSLLIIIGLATMLVIKHFEPTKTETKIIKVDATGKPISILTEKNGQ